MARSPVFDGVDARLVNLINQVGGSYGPYGVRTISGARPGSRGYHGKNRALDVELFNRDTGATLENYQDPSTFGAYQQFANSVYGAADPELQKQLRWGGYFSGGKGKYGALDLMHFDLGGLETPMGGGSWAGGLTPEQAAIWGLQSGSGGAGGQQQGPAAPQQVTDYSAEQRRNAIASIESAGSGDYSALGPVTNRQGDRAYGRYQIMGSNIPAWTKQVLGQEMTPDQFVANPKAQDAVFDAIFGDYVKKYGERGAAQAWFGGPGNVGKEGAQDILGTNVGGYGDKYLKALGAPGGATTQLNVQTPGTTATPTPYQPPSFSGEKKPSISEQLTGSMGDIADSLMAGAGKGSKMGGSVPNVQMAKPQAYFSEPVAANTINPEAAQMSRDRLAMAMARLNSGKLFVG